MFTLISILSAETQNVSISFTKPAEIKMGFYSKKDDFSSKLSEVKFNFSNQENYAETDTFYVNWDIRGGNYENIALKIVAASSLGTILTSDDDSCLVNANNPDDRLNYIVKIGERATLPLSAENRKDIIKINLRTWLVVSSNSANGSTSVQLQIQAPENESGAAFSSGPYKGYLALVLESN